MAALRVHRHKHHANDGVGKHYGVNRSLILRNLELGFRFWMQYGDEAMRVVPAMLAIAVASLSVGTVQSGLRAGHAVAFIGVEKGVALEILDWGGSGRPLIVLAGLNNTAHVFDEFAPHFTARFHVIGITRRGFGASSRPENGYRITTLAHDVLMVCDRLRLDRVVLVGHSIAGDELTTFAATYPTRVGALVYLDAAYDRTKAPQSTRAPEQPMTDADRASLEALNARFARVFGWRLPEDELRAQLVIDSHDKPLRSTLSPEIAEQVLESVETPHYSKVRAPALALYEPGLVRSTYPNYDAFDADNRARADQSVTALRPWREASMAQFRHSVRKGRIIGLTSGNHYIFLTNEAEVVGTIRRFLDSVLEKEPAGQ